MYNIELYFNINQYYVYKINFISRNKILRVQSIYGLSSDFIHIIHMYIKHIIMTHNYS